MGLLRRLPTRERDMEILLTGLLVAGLFYLIMRFGCCAHMNHAKQAGHSGSADTKPSIDQEEPDEKKL